MINIPDLKIERDDEDPDTNVMLEQDDGCGNIQTVYLHPIQVRLLAERMGLLAPITNLEADWTIARLCRQMRTLYERINFLDDWLHDHSDHEHADLDYEMTYSMATWELANEFIKDLPDEQGAANSSQTGTIPRGNTPENGGLSSGKGPKNGCVKAANIPKSGGVSGKGQLPLPEGEAKP